MLGELGTFTKGAPLSKADISENGTPFILYGELYTTYKEVTNHIVRKTNKEVDSSQYSRVGDVIIPTSGETPEEIATATCVMLPNVILAGDLNIFRSEMVDGRIISYIINHIVNRDISRIAQGKSVVHIKADELSKISINYPDVDEQNKLITFLTVLSDRIEKQRQLVEALKSYKRGALSKLFPQKGETVPKYRFAGFTEPWEQRELGEIATEIVAGGDVDKDLLVQDGRYPVIANALSNDGIIGYYQSEFRIKAPAVTVTGRGDVGHAQARNVDFTPVVRLLSLKSEHDIYFLENAINTLKIVVESTGIPQLTVPQLGKYRIFYPKDKEEESIIGQFFLNIDNLITLHQRELDELQIVKAWLLQVLFI